MKNLNEKTNNQDNLKQWIKPEVVDVDASVESIQTAVGPSADFSAGSSTS